MKTILNKTFEIMIATMKVYWFVSFCGRVKKKINTISTCFSGQFVNRPKKHVSGWTLVFQPRQAHPKSFLKSGRSHCERRLLIFSSFKCLDFFLLSIMCDFFYNSVSICVWATPSYSVNLTAIAKTFFFACCLVLKLRSDKFFRGFIDFKLVYVVFQVGPFQKPSCKT